MVKIERGHPPSLPAPSSDDKKEEKTKFEKWTDTALEYLNIKKNDKETEAPENQEQKKPKIWHRR